MLIRSSPSLHYPITIKELLKRPKDSVERFAPLFSYFYKSKVTEGTEDGEKREVERTFPQFFESMYEGTLIAWKIKQGDVLTAPHTPLLELEEPCRHEVQFGGMCANCGQDMTRITYATAVPDVARATVNMTHGNTALLVSESEAAKLSDAGKRRLLDSRKLSLVVDLDQTIIHATVEPTVAEWQKDENNPNHAAVKDVKAFQLMDEAPGVRGCWYYIKLRPGLLQFLENISKIYELHIYTMGTRAYARNIAKIVDPEGKIFADRILSRDESGSLTSKNIHRLFPVDTKMVVIIDDRGDVWGWRNNLIKVTPYDFFVGIGDINSSFLPKRQEAITRTERITDAPEDGIDAAAEAAVKASAQVTESDADAAQVVDAGEADGPASDLEQQLVAMAGANSADAIQQKASEQDEAIATQMADRPLLQKQKLLEEKIAHVKEHAEENGESTEELENDMQQYRQNLLRDDDGELEFLELNLTRIHNAFFEEFDRRVAGSHGGRVAALRGEKGAKKLPADDLQFIPDTMEIMPAMKAQVLKDVVVVFSGVVPLGINVQQSDIALWAKSFGAQVYEKISKRTTHVVAAKNRRTAKVRQAARHAQIKIVTTGWLLDSFTRWERADETPHLIHVEPDEHGAHSPTYGGLPFDDVDEHNLSSSEEDAAVTEDEIDGPLRIEVGGEAVEGEPEPLSPTDQENLREQIHHTDWDAIEAEMKEFMDDDSEDDASASDTSTDSRASAKENRKRKRETQSEKGSDAEDSDSSTASGSRLQKRKKKAMQRVTSLTNVTSADKTPGYPSPETTGPEEDQGGDEHGDEDEDGFNDDDFEAMFDGEDDGADAEPGPLEVGGENG